MKPKKSLLLSICVCATLFGCIKHEEANINWVKEPFISFTEDPIALYDKGFIVNGGSKQGFMDIDGKLLLDMSYKFQESFVKESYGVIEGVDHPIYLSQLLGIEGDDQGCWTGIVGPFTRYYYDSEQGSISEIRYDIEASTNIEATADLESALEEIHSDTFFQ